MLMGVSRHSSQHIKCILGVSKLNGIKLYTRAENKTDIVLQVSSLLKELHISQISDDDFSMEECEELRRKMVDGQLERPLVVELEQKAIILHKDVTKHMNVERT